MVAQSVSPTLFQVAEVASGDRNPAKCMSPTSHRQRGWHLGTEPHPGGVAHVLIPVPCSRGGIWGQGSIPVVWHTSPTLHQAAEVAFGDRVLVAQRVSQTWCIWGQSAILVAQCTSPTLVPAAGVASGGRSPILVARCMSPTSCQHQGRWTCGDRAHSTRPRCGAFGDRTPIPTTQRTSPTSHGHQG